MGLDKDDERSLAVFLCRVFSKHMSMQATESAKLAAKIVGRNERSVRRWRDAIVKKKGILPKSEQGRFRRQGIVWQNEELCEIARKYVQNNSSVRGKPNMTAFDFCRWVKIHIIVFIV